MGCDAADITLRTGTHGVSAVLLDTSDGWNGIRPPPTLQGSPNSPLLGRADAIAPVRLAVTTAVGKVPEGNEQTAIIVIAVFGNTSIADGICIDIE
jgi:hypothetical protein